MKKQQAILKGRALRPNAGIQSWYVRQLTELVARMCKAYQTRILSMARAQRKAAMDASEASQWRILLNELNREFADLFAQKAKDIAQSFITRQTRYANTAVKNSISAFGGSTREQAELTLQIPLYNEAVREVAKAAVFNNVNLIKSIQSQYFTQIAGAVSRAVLDDEGIGYLQEQIAKYNGQNKRRARNIAIDQTRKVFEAISFEKLKQAGVEKWEWVHGGGTKTVRHTHITDVKAGGLNHSIHNMGDKVWDKDAWGKGKGDWIEPGQLPFCSCFRRPVITLGA